MIIDKIKIVLSNYIEAYLTAHSFHWNVEGINFAQFHNLFSEIYTEYYEQIDVLAEFIRTLSLGSEYINCSVDIIKLNKTITTNIIVGNRPIDMCLELIRINNILINSFEDILVEAEKVNIQNTISSYFTEKLEKLHKLNWLLIAHTK